MSCDDRRDSVLLLAAGELEGSALSDLQDHIRGGCPRCLGALAEAEALLAHLPLSLEPVSPPAAVKSRLMARVAGSREAEEPEPGPRPEATPARRRSVTDLWLRPVLAAGLAASLTYLAVSVPMQRQRLVLESRIADQDREIRELVRLAESTRQTLRVLQSPGVQIVSLEGQPTQPDAKARIFWDRARRTWFFHASGLAPSEQGRTYELWFITADDRKISAGTFDVDASGEGSLRARVPEGVEPLALAAVTDEPAGGSPQPTGSIHLAGKVLSG